ncbi:hypothetical protein PAMC26577_26515 [Caballeronia sordidicola]|uniref:ChrR-like cupin domain-containing protein n=2 Tax=Burkholderiales TaxID=80840 RepID=A0A242MH34_CABSO|nr:hypothetical protein PAMC26577_26515 [Caballeronia sordidicola]
MVLRNETRMNFGHRIVLEDVARDKQARWRYRIRHLRTIGFGRRHCPQNTDSVLPLCPLPACRVIAHNRFDGQPAEPKIASAEQGADMQTQSIERAWVDLNAGPRGTCEINHLTHAEDAQWLGVVDLGPFATYTVDAGKRHDLYVLQGDAETDDHSLHTHDFLILCNATVVGAGESGARLLVYRQACASVCHPLLRTARDRAWREGVNPRMRVVSLANGVQHVSLVAWEPGARTRDHTHPSGEELFILSGEIRNAEECYPAGTWLRLHPGATHAPYAEVPTVILLRHGHLAGAA